MNDLSRDDPRNTPRVDGSIAWALVLVGLAAVMLRRWQDGALALYVHPSYEPLIAVTACSLLVVAGAQVWEAARQAAETGSRIRARAVWPVVVVGGAVVVTALVPARPLGSAVAVLQEKQAAELALPALRQLTEETTSWTLLEWAQALGGGVRYERIVGRPVSVIGFVHRPRLGSQPGEFLVTRFVVRCCAADGFAVSLPVRHPDADTFPVDSWVRVDGVLRIEGHEAGNVPYIEADTLAPMNAPATPYLSPT
jgi:uncharacterized repeat protein (TIGR03943 family)